MSGDLQVVLESGRVMLNCPTANYSYEDHYTYFRKALQQIRMRLSNVQSAVVILGLGLGSVPYALQKLYGANYPIDCVELDLDVIRLAKKYYPFKDCLERLIIHQANAKDCGMDNMRIFDLLIVDIFVDTRVPEQAHHIGFLQAQRRAVAPKKLCY